MHLAPMALNIYELFSLMRTYFVLFCTYSIVFKVTVSQQKGYKIKKRPIDNPATTFFRAVTSC